jgi:hypothetical protein
MDEVILTADGLLQTGNGATVSDPLRALGMRVVLGPGCTLRSFMRMLATHPDVTRLNDFAPEFAARFGRLPEGDSPPTGLARLELSRVVELIGHPAPARLEIYHSFRGVTAAGEDVEIKPWRVESLLDVPVRLGPLRHVVFGDRVDELRFETVCTLFEFLEGICWQLAFHGAPQECALRR